MPNENEAIDAKAIVESLASGESLSDDGGRDDASDAGADNVIPLPPNLAKKQAIVKKALALVQEKYKLYAAQPARVKLISDMKKADAMARLSRVRNVTDATDQQQDTLSNVASPSFYDSIRAITAGQKSVIFYGNEMPVKYERVYGSTDFPDDEEARRVELQQNMLLRYTFDQGDWWSALKRSMYFNNKYGQEMLSITWDRCTEMKTERVPLYDGTGKLAGFAFERREKVTRDFPIVERVDLKDVWFDTTIDDMRDQHVIIRRLPMSLSRLRQKARDNDRYLNLDKLNKSHLWRKADAGDESVMEGRLENADESQREEENGNYDGYYVWARLPIEATDKGSFVWNDKATPEWCEMYFAGDINSDCVCLQLRVNPYFHGKNPYNLVHSHEDDKGAIHMGYATLLECLYEEETTTINQFIDNKTKIINAPFVAEKGNLLEKKLTFNSNKVFHVRPGTGKTALTKLDYPDVTQTAMPMLQYLRERFNRTAGTDKPIMGEAWGSRTTATEAGAVMQQAMRPALEDAQYIAEQIFPWCAVMVAELWRQFADPDRVLYVTDQQIVNEVRPATLYGDYNTRIVTVGRFESDALRRSNENDFIARVLPLAQPLMSKRGLTEFFKDVMRGRKMDNAERYFEGSKEYDAERVAWMESTAMLESAVEDLPRPEEEHPVHLRIHRQVRDRYAMLPAEQQNQAALQVLDMHILIHEQMEAQAQVAPGAEPGMAGPGNMNNAGGMNQFGAPPVEQAAPQMTGEMAGDVAGGALGGLSGPT